MTKTSRLTTFEIGSIYGVAPHSLMFYEEQGLLSPVIEDGHRFYTAKDRIKLELIIKGKHLGFSLMEIKLLISQTIEQKASREFSSQKMQAAGQPSARADVAEEIAQAEKKIEELQNRVRQLRTLLAEENSAFPT